MRKLVFVVPLYSSYFVFIKDLCEKLINKNWEVFVFTKLPKGFKPTNNQVNFIDIEMPRSYQVLKYIKAAIKINKEIKQINPSIVHSHFSATAPVIKLSRISRFTNSYITIHGLISSTKTNKFVFKIFKLIEIFLYSGFKKVWVLTDSDLNVLKNEIPQLAVYPSKGLGCNLDIFNPVNFSLDFKKSLKNDLKINENDFVFIFVGRLTNFKGVDIVYQSFIKLKSEIAHVKLLVLGDFDPIHQSGLSEIELLNYNNNSDIIKIGMTDEVNKYLSIANVLVFPSFKEGMPVNLMESIAMGVPIITYNSRGNKDIVVNNQNGWILNERTTEVFYAKMKEVFLNRNLLDKISKNQLQERKLFDRNLFFDYQINFYEDNVNA